MQRNSQRILHIPFFSPVRSPESTELRENEIRLKEARKNASSAIGILIAIGHRIASPDMQQHLSNITLPFVIGKIPHVHFRVQKSYALLLLVSQLLCEHLPASVITYQDIMDFFSNEWARVICQIQLHGSDVLSDFLRQLIRVMNAMEVYEILQMIRPSVRHRGEPSIALYMLYGEGTL